MLQLLEVASLILRVLLVVCCKVGLRLLLLDHVGQVTPLEVQIFLQLIDTLSQVLVLYPELVKLRT
jgi:hypothetical protein